MEALSFDEALLLGHWLLTFPQRSIASPEEQALCVKLDQALLQGYVWEPPRISLDRWHLSDLQHELHDLTLDFLLPYVWEIQQFESPTRCGCRRCYKPPWADLVQDLLQCGSTGGWVASEKLFWAQQRAGSWFMRAPCCEANRQFYGCVVNAVYELMGRTCSQLFHVSTAVQWLYSRKVHSVPAFDGTFHPAYSAILAHRCNQRWKETF